MNGFENLPCLQVNITSEGLNGTVALGQYADFSIQSNNSEVWRLVIKRTPADVPLVWEVSYYVNTSYTGIPSMDFDITYTC